MPMSTWKKVVLMNGGGLIGILLSLFIVLPKTPLWLWATISAAALAALNYVSFGRRPTASGGSKSGWKSTAVIVLSFAPAIGAHSAISTSLMRSRSNEMWSSKAEHAQRRKNAGDCSIV